MYIIIFHICYNKLHAKERHATQNHCLEFLIVAYTFDFFDKSQSYLHLLYLLERLTIACFHYRYIHLKFVTPIFLVKFYFLFQFIKFVLTHFFHHKYINLTLYNLINI